MTTRPPRPTLDLVREVRAGSTTREEALLSFDRRLVAQSSLRIDIEPSSDRSVLRGVGAGRGAASGHAVFKAHDGLALARCDVPFVLIVYETFPDDIEVMKLSRGVLTVSGGITGHAGVVSRGLGKPCIGSGGDLDLRGESLEVRGPPPRAFRFGDRLSFDGQSGVIVPGAAVLARLSAETEEALGWADTVSGARIVASISTEVDAQNARAFGASAIAIDASDALFLGQAKEDVVAGVLRDEVAAAATLRDLLRTEIGTLGTAFGAPVAHVRRLRFPAFTDPRLAALLEGACNDVGVRLIDEPTKTFSPDALAEARLAAALDALGAGGT